MSKAGDPGALSVAQCNYILLLFNKQHAIRAARLDKVSEILGRHVATLNDLSDDDAGRVIDHLTGARPPARAEEPF